MDSEEITVNRKRKPRNRKFVRSILPEIDKLGVELPENIKVEAEKQSLIHIREKSVRKKKKKFDIASFIYKAHENTNVFKDPIAIGRMLGLTKGETLKAINSSEDNDIIFHFPHQYVAEYISYFQDIDHEMMSRKITAFCKKIYRMNSIILHEQPQNVAVAMIVYYCDRLGFNIENKNAFYKDVGRSGGTVSKQWKLICTIHNSGEDPRDLIMYEETVDE